VRICGFSIVRQAVRFGYPVEESLRSLLPLVDELVVGVGDGDDGTWELLGAIGDPKLALFRSTWDPSQRAGGEVLSRETNKALDRCRGDWAVYLQADEVLHEAELPALRRLLEEHRARATETISFRYFHFYGSYETIQDNPNWFYPRATRAVRLGIGVRSVGDACAFMVAENGTLRRPRRLDSRLHIYHYGRVRPPQVMLAKMRNFERLYHDDAWIHRHGVDAVGADVYGRLGHLRRFESTHPAVMRHHIAARDWSFDPQLDRQQPAWRRRSLNYVHWALSRAVARLRSR
jgi:hypothetical protein